MHICVYIYRCAGSHIYKYIFVHTYKIHLPIYVCLYIWIHLYTYIHIHVFFYRERCASSRHSPCGAHWPRRAPRQWNWRASTISQKSGSHSICHLKSPENWLFRNLIRNVPRHPHWIASMYMYTYIRVYVCIFIMISIHMYTHIYFYVYRHMDKYMCVYTYIFAQTLMHIHIYICIYTYTCTCFHTYINIYVYMHWGDSTFFSNYAHYSICYMKWTKSWLFRNLNGDALRQWHLGAE